MNKKYLIFFLNDALESHSLDEHSDDWTLYSDKMSLSSYTFL